MKRVIVIGQPQPDGLLSCLTCGRMLATRPGFKHLSRLDVSAPGTSGTPPKPATVPREQDRWTAKEPAGRFSEPAFRLADTAPWSGCVTAAVPARLGRAHQGSACMQRLRRAGAKRLQ